MGKSSGHEGILSILSSMKRGLLLDVPAGSGPVTEGAREMGFRVVEVDLFPPPKSGAIKADACAPLPFADETFDTVVSMEGIEHFENQTGFVRECARVLKPGGGMILTTPNLLHLRGRAAGFLVAQRSIKHGFVNEVRSLWGRDEHRLYHGHAFLIDAFRLRYILRVVGMKFERIETTSYSTTSLFLAPVVPLIWLATLITNAGGRRYQARIGREPTSPELERELRDLALSRALLFGKKLVMVARKEG